MLLTGDETLTMMLAPALALLPSLLVALPLIASMSGRPTRRKPPKRSPRPASQASSDPKGKGPQPPRLPPDKNPRNVHSPSEIHLSVDVPPGTKVRLTVGTAGTDRRRGALSRTFDQVFEVPGAEQPPTPIPGERTASEQPHVSPPDRLGVWADSVRETLRAVGREFRHTLADPGAGPRQWGGTLGWTALALGVYLLVRLIGLASYPIYFFTDEAVQTVLAADFVKAGFRDFLGHFFPTYFQNV